MWWGDPNDFFISEETEKTYDVIVKDRKGKPIGLEKIGFFPEEVDPVKYIRKKAGFLLEAKKRLMA